MKPKVGQEIIMNRLVYGILRSFSFIVSSRWVKKMIFKQKNESQISALKGLPFGKQISKT